MPKGLQIFKETDLRRAIKTFQKLGLPIARAEIHRDGKIVVVVGDGNAKAENNASELDRWLAKQGNTNNADATDGH